MRRVTAFALVLLIAGAAVHSVPIPSKTAKPQLKDIEQVTAAVGLTGECKDLYVSYLEIFSMCAEDIRGECALEDGHVLVFKNLQGSFYKGAIAGSVKVTLGKKVSYRVELTFRDIDFQWFAMNFFDPGTDFRGVLSGTITASGNTEGDVHGTLDLRLRNGYFHKLPRWFTMFSLVNVNPMRANVISKGKVSLTIERDKFVIQECRMESEDIVIYGNGKIDFDGDADIVLNPVGRHKFTSVFLPPLAVIWKTIEKGIWRVHIKGPLFSLQYRVLPLYRL